MGNLNNTFANLLLTEDRVELEHFLSIFRRDLLQFELELDIEGSNLIFVEMLQFRLLRDDPVWKKLPNLKLRAHQVLKSNNQYMKRFREEVKDQNLGPLLEFIE